LVLLEIFLGFSLENRRKPKENQIKFLTKYKFYVIYLFFFIKGYFSTFENKFLNPFFSLFLGFSYPFPTLLPNYLNPFSKIPLLLLNSCTM
jgi:hypothetical protein